MELQVLKCPNCGANTTDHKNCEYCGSLLVRFADKGIEVDTAEFAADAAEYPGLLTELKRNLKLQEENPTEPVATDIMYEKVEGEVDGITILRTGKCNWRDGTPINIESKSNTGLSIVVDYPNYIDSSLAPDFDREMNEMHAKFKKLKSFPLFTSHASTGSDPSGNKQYSREYAIDFGSDAEGAAALISEILKNVEGIAPTDNFDICTNAGEYQIEKSRNTWYAAHGLGTNDDSESGTSFKKYLWYILMIILWLLWFIMQ